MGKKRKSYENGCQFARCEVCHDDIPIEFYFAKGEKLFCSNCYSEYVVQSKRPPMLKLSKGYYAEGDLNITLGYD